MSSQDRRKGLLNKPAVKLSKCLPNLKRKHPSSDTPSPQPTITQTISPATPQPTPQTIPQPIPQPTIAQTITPDTPQPIPQPTITQPTITQTSPTQQISVLPTLTKEQETTMVNIEQLLTSCIANNSNNTPLIILLHGETQSGKTFLIERFLLKHSTKIEKRYLEIEAIPLSLDQSNFLHFNKWMQNIALLLQERPMFSCLYSNRIPVVVLDNYDSLFRSFNTSDIVDENTIAFKLLKSVQTLMQIYSQSKAEFFVAILISTIKPEFVFESFQKYFQQMQRYRNNFVSLMKDTDLVFSNHNIHNNHNIHKIKSFCDYRYTDDDYENLLEFEHQRNELFDLALFNNHSVNYHEVSNFYDLYSHFSISPYEFPTILLMFLKESQHNQSLKQHFAKLFESWSLTKQQFGTSLSFIFRLYKENLWPNVNNRKREWKLRQIENFSNETINTLSFYRIGLDDYNGLKNDILFDQWPVNG
jgi:hypothetical protein